MILLLAVVPCQATVLFHTDFSGHTVEWENQSVGTVVEGTHNGGDPGLGVPDPWTGYINQAADNDLKILTSGGRGDNGSVLRIGPQYDTVTNQVGLTVYLPNTSGVYDYQGYNEIYLQFYFKYSDDWDWVLSWWNFCLS